MSDLHSLIARLEAATGPVRELDEAIHALGFGERVIEPPAYTRSLDAALTLLPEGCGLKLRRYWRAAPGVWWSSTLFMSAAPVKRIGAEDAPTAALALLTAILKARAGEKKL